MEKSKIILFYRSLYMIRRVEEEIVRIYPTDEIKSPVHLSIGQEAVAVGICSALAPGDIVFGTYRGHAMYLAKGGDLNKMIAELYGKESGCAKGKGGSMHLVDAQAGVMGTSAIVATTIPVSVGYALGLDYRNKKNVVVSFFGDGATDEGAFHESMNFAVIKKLPILFVCENNQYAIHSHLLQRRNSDNIFKHALAYGMPAMRIKNGDIFKIHQTAKKFLHKVRSGAGPAFLECFTSRWKEHVGPGDDFHLGYRNAADLSWWKKNDQLEHLKKMLPLSKIRRIESLVEDRIAKAFEFAKNCPFPKPRELFTDVFQEQ